MGVTVASLLVGALRSSATARILDLFHRGTAVLSHIKKGDNMKRVMGITAVAAIVVGGAAVGMKVNTMQGPPQSAAAKAMHETTIAGYDGWWNSTPASGDVEGLPQETVAVSTRTGAIVDASNRAINAAGRPTLISDVHFTPVRDDSWPADSVVIIDTATGKVIDDFRVDERGVPLNESGLPLDSARR